METSLLSKRRMARSRPSPSSPTTGIPRWCACLTGGGCPSRTHMPRTSRDCSRWLTTTSPATLRSTPTPRSEEHTSELQSHSDLVCRLLLEKKKRCVCYEDVTIHTKLRHLSLIDCMAVFGRII